MYAFSSFRRCDAGAATFDWIVMLICIAALALFVVNYVFSGLGPMIEIIERPYGGEP